MITFLGQPTGALSERLGEQLIATLVRNPPFRRAIWLVAFAKQSGLARLVPAMRTFRQRGGHLTIVVGIDLLGTSQEALEVALAEADEAFVFNNPGSSTFHSKVYVFDGPGAEAEVFVGSQNLTAGGLFTNYESAVHLDLDTTQPEARLFMDQVEETIAQSTDVGSGNVVRLDRGSLDRLKAAGLAPAEVTMGTDASDARSRQAGALIGVGNGPLFRHLPVPPPPKLGPVGVKPSPKVPPTLTDEAFVMTMGPRDTTQAAGFSRDIFIPRTARTANTAFWGWPAGFGAAANATTLKGTYLERRLNLLVHPVVGNPEVLAGVRLYDYAEKSEFRLNCGALTVGAAEHDILVVERPSTPSTFQGLGYEYTASVVRQGTPTYAGLLRCCTESVPGSNKRWGYISY